jgi:hypothetical protein
MIITVAMIQTLTFLSLLPIPLVRSPFLFTGTIITIFALLILGP